MSEESKEITQTPQVQAFASMSGFEIAQRMAKALAESDLVPQIYRGKLANCLVALEVSQRCKSSVLMTMQNLHIIQGKPGWSAQYIIAAVNACGKFSPLRFKMSGTGDKLQCQAVATEIRTGEILEGPPVSIAMAKSEGWYDKNGSKWKTMPDLMLRYRAASFFGKLYSPELLMGIQSQDEIEDVVETTGRAVHSKSEELHQKLAEIVSTPVLPLDESMTEPAIDGEFAKFDDPKVVK